MFSIYYAYTWKIPCVFSNHMLRFVNSVALKTQFTSKWTQSEIVKDNFPITQGHHVIGDYNSPEQSIWPRPWEVTCHTQNAMLSQPLLSEKKPQNQQTCPPLKTAHMYTLDRIHTQFISHGLGQIDYSGEL